MAYYILAKYLAKDWVSFKRFEKSPEDLPDAFFDYIFLGEGSAEAIIRETRISKRTIEGIRKEFTYFYPVDMRHSAKDLVSNHLSMYILNNNQHCPSIIRPTSSVAK